MQNDPEFLEKQKQFWIWFSENESRISEADPDLPIFDEILRKLQVLDSRLYFELSTNQDPKDFVITAQGNTQLFPFIDMLVSSAPSIPGWKITALKPPMGFEFTTQYEDIALDPSQMWFLPLESKKDPASLGLRVAAPNLDPKQKWARAAVLAIIDTGIGERSAAIDIQMVQLESLPDKPEDCGYIELVELAKYIDWRKKRLKKAP